jgi:hypothetical protein
MIWIVYALAGLVSILTYLLKIGKAGFSPVGEVCAAGCVDRRVLKKIPLFGGAAGFTFGWYYFIFGALSTGALHELFTTYALVRFIFSVVNTVMLLAQLPELTKGDLYVKAHLQGCGFTSAWSVFWPLYWLGKLPHLGWLERVRDGLTALDFAASVPSIWLLSLFTRLRFGVRLVPRLTSVDVRA